MARILLKEVDKAFSAKYLMRNNMNETLGACLLFGACLVYLGGCILFPPLLPITLIASIGLLIVGKIGELAWNKWRGHAARKEDSHNSTFRRDLEDTQSLLNKESPKPSVLTPTPSNQAGLSNQENSPAEKKNSNAKTL